jgi:putative ABC transport system permease protein
MMLTRCMFREWRRRPGRTTLTLLGIVIGVQSLVAVPLTISSTRYAQRALFEGVAGKAALEVVPCGQGGFAPDASAAVAEVKGVKRVAAIIQSPAGICGDAGLVPVIVLGVDAQRDGDVREYALARGSLLQGEDQLLLEAGFAESLGIELGTTARLLTPAGLSELRVVGLLQAQGAGAINAGGVAIIPRATAQRLFRLPGQVNCLNLVLDSGAGVESVRHDVAQVLPAGLTVQKPAARAVLARETLAHTEQMLAALSITSLVAGAFIILNTFLMNVGERRHALAILRSLGATRRQITRLLLIEALTLGTLGTIVGVPLGVLAATIMTRAMALLSGMEIGGVQWSLTPFLLAAILGPGVTLLAAWVPAVAAARQPPLEQLRADACRAASSAVSPRRRLGYAGIGLLAVFAVLFAVILSGRLPDDCHVVLLPLSMALLLTGSALTVPLVLQPLLQLSARLLRPLFGTEALLAVRQLHRHPTRSALVVGVLLISVTLSTGFGAAVLNALRDTRAWMGRVFEQVDFLVTSTELSGTELLPAAMPESDADGIGKLAGVRLVGTGTVLPGQVAGRSVMIFARSCAPGEDPGFRLLNPDREHVGARLRHGEVVIGTALARRIDARPGDSIEIATRAGTRSFTVADLTPDYTAGGMIVLMEWECAKRFFAIDGVRYVYLTAAPGARENVARELRAFCAARRLRVHSRAGFLDTCNRMMAGALGAAWTLLGLVFVVAALGIFNVLNVNVLEQTRELGVLRAIGMRRRQVGRMIVAQALAIGLVGLMLGLPYGVVLSYAVTSASESVTDIAVPYRLEPTLLAGCAAMALGVCWLAVLWPARQARRLVIVRALQYE